jgi:hypothetical protein
MKKISVLLLLSFIIFSLQGSHPLPQNFAQELTNMASNQQPASPTPHTSPSLLSLITNSTQSYTISDNNTSSGSLSSASSSALVSLMSVMAPVPKAKSKIKKPSKDEQDSPQLPPTTPPAHHFSFLEDAEDDALTPATDLSIVEESEPAEVTEALAMAQIALNSNLEVVNLSDLSLPSSRSRTGTIPFQDAQSHASMIAASAGSHASTTIATPSTHSLFTDLSPRRGTLDYNRELIRAARDGKLKELQEILKQQVDVNYIAPGHTKHSLAWAVFNMHDDIINALLATKKVTPLMPGKYQTVLQAFPTRLDKLLPQTRAKLNEYVEDYMAQFKPTIQSDESDTTAPSDSTLTVESLTGNNSMPMASSTSSGRLSIDTSPAAIAEKDDALSPKSPASSGARTPPTSPQGEAMGDTFSAFGLAGVATIGTRSKVANENASSATATTQSTASASTPVAHQKASSDDIHIFSTGSSMQTSVADLEHQEELKKKQGEKEKQRRIREENDKKRKERFARNRRGSTNAQQLPPMPTVKDREEALKKRASILDPNAPFSGFNHHDLHAPSIDKPTEEQYKTMNNLLVGAKLGNLQQVIGALDKEKADIETYTTSNGQPETALILAVKNKRNDVIEELMKRKANPFLKLYDGSTDFAKSINDDAVRLYNTDRDEDLQFLPKISRYVATYHSRQRSVSNIKIETSQRASIVLPQSKTNMDTKHSVDSKTTSAAAGSHISAATSSASSTSVLPAQKVQPASLSVIAQSVVLNKRTQLQINKMLLLAAKKNDRSQFALALTQGADKNYTELVGEYEFPSNAFIWALYFGFPEIVAELINRGADSVIFFEEQYMSVLDYVKKYLKPAKIKTEIETQIQKYAKIPVSNKIFMQAASQGDVQKLVEACQNDAEINHEAKDGLGRTINAFALAIFQGHNNIVSKLIDMDAKPYIDISNKRIAIHDYVMQYLKPTHPMQSLQLLKKLNDYTNKKMNQDAQSQAGSSKAKKVLGIPTVAQSSSVSLSTSSTSAPSTHASTPSIISPASQSPLQSPGKAAFDAPASTGGSASSASSTSFATSAASSNENTTHKTTA